MAVHSFTPKSAGASFFSAFLLFSHYAFAQTGSVYQLDTEYAGVNFFDGWDFYTGGDPTGGFVTYYSRSSAQSAGMIDSTSKSSVYVGSDYTTFIPSPNDAGRPSVRISSQRSWTHGLFIGDFNHAPGGVCGTWPAFWTLGPNWPYTGEIDIMEGANLNDYNGVTLHSSPSCSIANNSAMSGVLQTQDCAYYGGGNVGCSISDERSSAYGTTFNQNGGGVYAMQWTSGYIRVWFFSRGAIPSDITNLTPDPASWGVPAANFEGSCVIDQHFQDHKIILNNAFCGQYAGLATVWNSSSVSCATQTGYTTCNAYVASQPAAFQDAYWSINSIRVYQLANSSSSPSSSSSYIASLQPTSATAVPSSTGTTPTVSPGTSLCPTYYFTVIEQSNLEYEIVCGYNPGGPDIGAPKGPNGNWPVNSFQDCVAGCSYWNNNIKNNSCAGVAYIVSSNACYWKSSISSNPNQPGYNGARLIYYAYPQVTDNPNNKAAPATTSATSPYVFTSVPPATYVAPSGSSTISFSQSAQTPASSLTEGVGMGGAATTSSTTGAGTSTSTSLSNSSASPTTTARTSSSTGVTTSATTTVVTTSTTATQSSSGTTTRTSTVPSSVTTSLSTSLSSSTTLPTTTTTTHMSQSSTHLTTTTTTTPATTTTLTSSSSATTTSRSVTNTTVQTTQSTTIGGGASPSQPPASTQQSSMTSSTSSTTGPASFPTQTSSTSQISSSLNSETLQQSTSPPAQSIPSSTSATPSNSVFTPYESVTMTTTSTAFPTQVSSFTYVGCLGPVPDTNFTDSFLLAQTSENMTIDACVSDCAGQQYAGIFDTQCFCSDYIGAPPASDVVVYPDDACDTPCPGDTTQDCGGMAEVSGARFIKRQASATTSAGSTNGDVVLLITVFNNTQPEGMEPSSSSSTSSTATTTPVSMMGSSSTVLMGSVPPSTSLHGLTTSSSPAQSQSLGPVLMATTPSSSQVSGSSSSSLQLSPTTISTTYTAICAANLYTCPIPTATCLATTITVMHCGCTDMPEPTVPMTTTTTVIPCAGAGSAGDAGEATTTTTLTVPCTEAISSMENEVSSWSATATATATATAPANAAETAVPAIPPNADVAGPVPVTTPAAAAATAPVNGAAAASAPATAGGTAASSHPYQPYSFPISFSMTTASPVSVPVSPSEAAASPHTTVTLTMTVAPVSNSTGSRNGTVHSEASNGTGSKSVVGPASTLGSGRQGRFRSGAAQVRVQVENGLGGAMCLSFVLVVLGLAVDAL